MKQLKYIFIFAFSFALFTALKPEHEYYVSVTKVEYVKEQKSVQIISQIFMDDFEKLLRERYDKSITLAKKNELNSVAIETYMQKYLQYKLNFKINSKDMVFKFIGKEYKDDIVYCYLEIENVKNIKTITIKNEVLFDIFEDQQNILRTKINGKDKSFILVPQNNKAVLNFD
jgi:hypothetical protein